MSKKLTFVGEIGNFCLDLWIDEDGDYYITDSTENKKANGQPKSPIAFVFPSSGETFQKFCEELMALTADPQLRLQNAVEKLLEDPHNPYLQDAVMHALEAVKAAKSA